MDLSHLDVARALREIAAYLRLQPGQRFKVRAYERAAHALEQGAHDLDALIAAGALTTIPGVGERLAGVIEELRRRGSSRLLDSLRREFPPGTIELIDLPGLGLEKIAALHRELGVTSREDLRRSCEEDRVRQVRGFGARTQAALLEALTRTHGEADDHLLWSALRELEPLIGYLERGRAVLATAVVGQVRRRAELVDRLELVVASDDAEAALDHALAYPSRIATVVKEPRETTFRLLSGPLVTLHVASPEAFVNARHWFTGSAAHVRRMAERAAALGLRIDAAGLWTADGTRLRVAEEADLYRRLGWQPVPAELRENAGEIEAAAAGTLPQLVDVEDIRGMTHVHTTYSDGRDSIEAMGRAAEALGMSYLTITDHSPSAGYAGGVSWDRLLRQWDEIAAAQERLSIRLLRGTESDILRDGALDYSDAELEQFDVIIASIHARHRLGREEMTERVRRAMEVPVFKIWGHPLGRLLRHRDPIDCDVENILDAIAQAPAAIEINGDPYRLDLPPAWIPPARERGIRFVLSTDAHSTRGLRNLRFAVDMARRGGLTRADVLNALPVAEFVAAVRPYRP